MEKSFIQHPSSYRDPSGFIFLKEGVLYRQVNKVFAGDFDFFISSGCYEKLVLQKLLLPHEAIQENLTGSPEWHITLKPEPAAFLSWPYEWSFDMLKDAALLTLRLVRESVASGLILKDAAPYNVQWHKGRLIFIDTLSFEKYNEAAPWIAYRQFCEQFLGPLLLMHYRKMPLHQLLLAWPEGIPLNIIRSLLPGSSKFSLHTYLHIHLNARISSKGRASKKPAAKFSKQKLLNLITSLEALVNKLKLPAQKSAWSDYYDEASGRSDYLKAKKKIIGEWIDSVTGVTTAADLGANDGEFSRLAADRNIYTIAADFDPWCINNLYRSIKQSGQKNIQPLIADLSNPSPAIGFNNNERISFISRLKVDLCLALALIHHLCIGKNLSLEMTADFFSRIGRKALIIEFVPKSDEKVQLMLSVKKDIYTAYTEDNFKKTFSSYFQIARREVIGYSGRVLYLMTPHEK